MSSTKCQLFTQPLEQCCCNCFHHIPVYDHCDYKKHEAGECICNQRVGWICLLTFPNEEPRAFRNWPKHSPSCMMYQPIKKCTCSPVIVVPGIVEYTAGIDDCAVHGFPGKYPKEHGETKTNAQDL